MLIKKLIFLVLLFLSVSFQVKAKESCTNDNLICTDFVKDNNEYQLLIKNYNTFPITISIEFTKFENMKTDELFPYSVSIPPHKLLRSFKIYQDNKNKAYRFKYNFFTVSGSMNITHDDNYIYTLPYNHHESYKVIQGFNGKYTHFGEQRYSLDFNLPEGTEVRAAREGTVVGIKDDSNIGGWGEKYAKYANYVYIEHSDGTIGGYIHLKKHGVKVKIGDKVKVGDVIALSGNTGWSGGPHLHFWVYKALNGKERESFPIKFKTSDSESEILIEGKNYLNP